MLCHVSYRRQMCRTGRLSGPIRALVATLMGTKKGWGMQVFLGFTGYSVPLNLFVCCFCLLSWDRRFYFSACGCAMCRPWGPLVVA
jgi:hypothetical protein